MIQGWGLTEMSPVGAVGHPPADARPGTAEGTDPAELRDFLARYVAKWQVPENWAFVAEIPKTSVGKFDKKALRTQYEKGDLAPRGV